MLRRLPPERQRERERGREREKEKERERESERGRERERGNEEREKPVCSAHYRSADATCHRFLLLQIFRTIRMTDGIALMIFYGNSGTGWRALSSSLPPTSIPSRPFSPFLFIAFRLALCRCIALSDSHTHTLFQHRPPLPTVPSSTPPPPPSPHPSLPPRPHPPFFFSSQSILSSV